MELSKEARQYDLDALKANVEKIKNNIVMFEAEIEKEKKEIERLQMLINVLEEDQKKSTH
ncbi:MAG: hypothetical protein UY40_C0004G0015 [candidate division CPR1 bacterium GW2011_GWC1_49_13]|uniref:Uncharacterized protein n=1 Tax=candidate division CPR1 bacterium GW2011_GWC1_49_13 TaxID=1618342 RepID=A0A0G1VHU6_9BACT|nr:MAG: hypothetical protein UY40_C0004G0015 [candidate division CPR1 bacterium GW2011_GWC1_49_13]